MNANHCELMTQKTKQKNRKKQKFNENWIFSCYKTTDVSMRVHDCFRCQYCFSHFMPFDIVPIVINVLTIRQLFLYQLFSIEFLGSDRLSYAKIWFGERMLQILRSFSGLQKQERNNCELITQYTNDWFSVKLKMHHDEYNIVCVCSIILFLHIFFSFILDSNQ